MLVSFAVEVWRRHNKGGPPIDHSVSSCWLRTASGTKQFGGLPNEVADVNWLKVMAGPCGLEPQTSTVSIRLRERVRKPPSLKGFCKYLEIEASRTFNFTESGRENPSRVRIARYLLLSAEPFGPKEG